MRILPFLLFLFFFHTPFSGYAGINLQIPERTLSLATAATAIQDFQRLILDANGGRITVNSAGAVDVNVLLPDINTSIISGSFDTAVQHENYSWTVSRLGDKTVLALKAETAKGVANGLYGLLQEKMGFRFYHARATHMPDLSHFNFAAISSFEGEKVFDKIGFHLHTMHPIELTECLLDEKHPQALERVKEYIDWLARNGQNYFEFNLLESIHKKTWIPHARAIIAYAHQRGIYCGADLSLHMLQQKAFQLYQTPPASFRSKSHQLELNAHWLVPAGFDVWNVELSATEFSAGDMVKKSKLLDQLNVILKQHRVKLMSRKHVVKQEKMVSGKQQQEILSPEHGLMIHTVMFYSLLDAHAPVYENQNLQHMRDLLLAEMKRRETWYFPETAYWVTFDLTVPMLLLPYLKARLEDIEYCKSLGEIDGHLTFSSGWEWGYWLMDWSVARWCWDIVEEGHTKEKSPLQYAHEMVQDTAFRTYLDTQAALQQKFIKEEELIRVMDAQTVTDELPFGKSLEFHPRPKYAYPYIRNKASLAELDTVRILYLDKLAAYILAAEKIPFTGNRLSPEENEFRDGIAITILRARHRYYTLRYLTEFRAGKIRGQKPEIRQWLDSAALVRKEAVKIVRDREAHYRYPFDWIVAKRPDHTCYHFGYLYTVHDLHFWEREELQARKNKYHFWYRNIWNIWRVMGIIN